MRLLQSSCFKLCRTGGVTPLTVLNVSMLLAVVALVVDGGSLLEERRHVQATADAAALAAASDLFANYVSNQGADPLGTAQASALATAAANGFSNDGVQSIVTVSVSPQKYQGGPKLGQALPPGYAEVIVQYNAGRTFSAMFGSGAIPVCARAVARGQWTSLSNSVVLLSLRASGVLTTTGSASLSTTGGIQINSSSATALSLASGTGVTASQFNLNQAGGTISGSTLASLHGPGGTSPTVHYGGTSPDPLRSLSDPDSVKLGLPLRATNLQVNGGSTMDLYPGVYSGGIAVSAGSKAILHANSDGTPGIYFLQGGGFTVSDTSSVTTAAGETAGIMIYNNWSLATDAISLSGSGSLTITPPSSGTYQGICIFQKRGTVSTSAPAVSLTGGSTANVTGTIYAAYANVTMKDPSGTSLLGGQVIADTLTLTGSATININRGSHPIANTRTLGLVE